MRGMQVRLALIKSLFVVIVILNLFLPVFTVMQVGAISLFQWAIVFVFLIAALNSLGYFNHWIPILPWFFVRSLEVLYYRFVSGRDLYWEVFWIVLVLDLIYFAILLETKSNYKFVRISK